MRGARAGPQTRSRSPSGSVQGVKINLNRANGETYVDVSSGVPYNSSDHIVKILMIAPEPFFEPRGTPFSEYHRIRALLELGSHGRSRHVSLWPRRVAAWTCACSAVCVRRLSATSRIGPSFAKLPLDLALALDGAPARAGGAVRRRALARGGQLHRRGDREDARHSASLRHALEPAAAAQQLLVQPLQAADEGFRVAWSASSSAARRSSS